MQTRATLAAERKWPIDFITHIILLNRLNAIREICARCPLVMNAELLHDLVDYRSSKQKSVMMAARSILQLYRVVNPELLPRKERVRRLLLQSAS